MKKVFVLALSVLFLSSAFAQKKAEDKKAAPLDVPKSILKKELPQPFKGGVDSMMLFFKDNLIVSPEIVKAKASGTAIIKFAVDTKGFLVNIVIYYADDYMLTVPATNALRRSNTHWVIPKEVESYEYVAQFVYQYKPTAGIKPAAMKSILDYNSQPHKQIIAHDQVPLLFATLLPTIVVNYQ